MSKEKVNTMHPLKTLALVGLAFAVSSSIAIAGDPPMGFFVTSVGSGAGLFYCFAAD